MGALAPHIEETTGPLEAAVQEVREKAQAELQRREDKWRPIARPLSDWLAEARQARKGAQATKPLKAAGAFLTAEAPTVQAGRYVALLHM
jgi:hypothetical protein